MSSHPFKRGVDVRRLIQHLDGRLDIELRILESGAEERVDGVSLGTVFLDYRHDRPDLLQGRQVSTGPHVAREMSLQEPGEGVDVSSRRGSGSTVASMRSLWEDA